MMARAYRARVQSLADSSSLNYVALPDSGEMGTNKAFINKGDGKGLRGTAKLSGFGTDAAFINKGDGKGLRDTAKLSGFGTDAAFMHKAGEGGISVKKAKMQSLYQESFEQAMKAQNMYDQPRNSMVHTDSAGHVDVENFGVLPPPPLPPIPVPPSLLLQSAASRIFCQREEGGLFRNEKLTYQVW